MIMVNPIQRHQYDLLSLLFGCQVREQRGTLSHHSSRGEGQWGQRWRERLRRVLQWGGISWRWHHAHKGKVILEKKSRFNLIWGKREIKLTHQLRKCSRGFTTVYRWLHGSVFFPLSSAVLYLDWALVVHAGGLCHQSITFLCNFLSTVCVPWHHSYRES